MTINNLDTSSQPSLCEILEQPSHDQLEFFERNRSKNDPKYVEKGFRSLAAGLFASDQINMDQYVSIFGGHALNYLTEVAPGTFKYMDTELDANELVTSYSRAKHGSIQDINALAFSIINYLSVQLDQPESHWARLFREAKERNDTVAMMTTGWRNVPSTSNVLYSIVVREINLKLANLELPTIVEVKLPRIAPPCENYGALSAEEREIVNRTQDHVIPAENFYRWGGVHVIFGDDVLVTGATADKVLYESIMNGAKSFQSIYPIAIDPRLSLSQANIEERLNTALVKEVLDETVYSILSSSDFQPILRTLRLVFSKKNQTKLSEFLPQLPRRNLLELYKAALGSELMGKDDTRPSLKLLRKYLFDAGLLDSNGLSTEW